MYMARFLGIFIIVVNNIKNKNNLFFLLYEIFRWNYGNVCCNRLINRSLNCFKSIVVVVVIRDNRILRVVCILFVHPDTDGRHARQQTFYRQTGELEANVRQLQTKQQQAERLLDEVKKEIKSEKLEAAKTEAKTAFVAKVGSLLGGNKLKTEREELQQRLSVLEKQNEKLMQHIKQMEWEHQSERTKFNEYMDKIQRYFPHVGKLLPLIDFCRNTLKFSERVIQELCKLKKVRLKGDFYSPEFNRKFRDENATFSFEEDKNRKGHYHICVNDIPLVQWFKEKAHEWRKGLGFISTKHGKGLKI